MKRNTSQHGFTIIETLVAITILMIAIAGPLTIANKSYQAAVLAHDQLTASYLAQDELEYVKNIRDYDLMAPPANGWLTDFSSCTSSNPCAVDTLNGSPYTSGPSSKGILNCGHSCVLYKDGYGYTYRNDPSKSVTPFSRYFYINQTIGGNPDEATLVVIVSWMSGLVQNQVEYDNEIFNVLK